MLGAGGGPCTFHQPCLGPGRGRGCEWGTQTHWLGVAGEGRTAWSRSEETWRWGGGSLPLDFLDLCPGQAAGQLLPGPVAGGGQDK